jgi:hypothetical protein
MALDILSTNTNILVSNLQEAGLFWAGPADPIHFTLIERPAVAGPRTNDLAPVNTIPWDQMTAAQKKKWIATVGVDALNKKIMKPW